MMIPTQLCTLSAAICTALPLLPLLLLPCVCDAGLMGALLLLVHRCSIGEWAGMSAASMSCRSCFM
jgi:hypothetical protein